MFSSQKIPQGDFVNLLQHAKNLIARLASLVTGYAPDRRVTDDGNWDLIAGGGGPSDRNWQDIQDDLRDTLEAWRKNFLIRQIVRLCSAYVIGDGIKITSKRRNVQKFIDEFYDHRQNKISRRLLAWCDELTRSGEIFIALFTNPVDGMSYVRAVPAASIRKVECDPEDYEREIAYHETVPGQIEPKIWKSKLTAGPKEAALLHYTINKPVGATRGESDLTPVLPWAKRYGEWLKDRVRFNRLRNELAAVELRTKGNVEMRKKQILKDPPLNGSITVTQMDEEELIYHAAQSEGGDAEPDGRAQRLAIATGANIPLHFLAEGDTANRATAVEMGDPTHRFYRSRQNDIVDLLTDLCEQAYLRKVAAGLARLPANGDLKFGAELPDISRADNNALATAAATIVGAFAVMKAQGWITDEIAIRLAFKFCGEILEEEVIQKILTEAKEAEPPPDEETPPDEEEDEDQMSSWSVGNLLLAQQRVNGH